jgi:hypothetical protein
VENPNPKENNAIEEMLSRFGQWFAVVMLFIEKLLSLNLTVEQVQKLLKDKKHPFWVAFDEATKLLVPPPISELPAVDTSRFIAEWELFYKKFFNININILEIKIPDRREGFDRLIVIPKGITLNQVWEVCRKQFNCWKYTDSADLESVVTKNDRDSKGSTYAVWVRDVVEADEEMKNLSANDLKEKAIKGVTLLERLILELKYFSETKKHLDINNWTLCSGSRRSDGRVPIVGWSGGRLRVGWYDVDGRSDSLRSRVAVTL